MSVSAEWFCQKRSIILTVHFQPCLPLHRSCIIGGHTFKVPTVAGRCCANYESSISRHSKLWLFRVYLQAVLKPAHFGKRWPCRCTEKKGSKKWALLITSDKKKSFLHPSASQQENLMGRQPRQEKAGSTFICWTAGQRGSQCQNGPSPCSLWAFDFKVRVT